MNGESSPLLDILLNALPRVVTVLASILEASEELALEDDPAPADAWNVELSLSLSRKEVLAGFRDFCAQYPLFGTEDEMKERIGRVAVQAWGQSRNSGRRPDVLRLACDVLANAAHPSSRNALQFAAVLLLRNVYELTYTEADLEVLHSDYEDLKSRFNKTARRMRRKLFRRYEHFLVDLLCMQGNVWRSLTRQNVLAYLQGFKKLPLGIDTSEHKRPLAVDQEEPQLHGTLPDFPSLIALSFGQPYCVQGLDDVVWGAVPALPTTGDNLGGHITLVVGPPGSGKTSFCLLVASRMAELGSSVSYITTEEDAAGLTLKRATLGLQGSLFRTLFGVDRTNDQADFNVVQGAQFRDIEDLADQIETDAAPSPTVQRTNGARTLYVRIPFPRVVVVDSLTILMHLSQERAGRDVDGHMPESSQREPPASRRRIAEVLMRLRGLGVAIFLVGSMKDYDDQSLSYLVDNVYRLGVDNDRSSQHALRTIVIEKTRLQVSHRGTHVLHLSRHDGFTVAPSLHSTLRTLHDRATQGPDGTRRVRITALQVTKSNERRTPLLEVGVSSIRARAHTLICGQGSSGKSRFALWLSYQPRNPRRSRDARTPVLPPSGTRTLIASFLYDDAYYQRIYARMTRLEEIERSESERPVVLSFYPGYIDPELVVARIKHELDAAALAGVRFSNVIVDGLHNVLLQFPLLQDEPLLWPALYSLFRVYGVDVISTFTLFKLPVRVALDEEPQQSAPIVYASEPLYHLLVSASDYVYSMTRLSDTPMAKLAALTPRLRADGTAIRMEASLDSMLAEREFVWDGRDFKNYYVGARIAAARDHDAESDDAS